ncbi:MAG TPA: ferritin-like domain-containing protein [Solirubrobacteraceae bacterium]|jgi:bacterioferritin (cytochrome b1)|nr:ferritin-like domain-containing protein [Solirubrobacteraceae bacterium]
MPSDELLSADASRRVFLRTAGVGMAGASAFVLSACGSSRPKTKLVAGSDPLAVRQADIEILNSVLDLEYTAIAAYTAGIPLLTGHARAAAAQFLGHELSHAMKLASTIRGAGGKPNRQPSTYALTNPRDAAQVLDTLGTTESSLIDGYLTAIPKLVPGWLRAVAAGILANEGQHVSVLRLLQAQPPVPSAFVTASE